MNEQSWRKMMSHLSINSNLETFEELRAAYAQRHRHYHTAAHIESCLGLFNEHGATALNPAEVECAIWFHDSIYNPMSSNNEMKSADWAYRFLKKNERTDKQCDQVRAFIMATIHDAPAVDPDTRLLVDIDLAILGADEKTYGEFEANVRREYRWVPAPLFRRERKKILQSFLDRKTIYSTDPFRDRYEARARSNIDRVLRNI